MFNQYMLHFKYVSSSPVHEYIHYQFIYIYREKLKYTLFHFGRNTYVPYTPHKKVINLSVSSTYFFFYILLIFFSKFTGFIKVIYNSINYIN